MNIEELRAAAVALENEVLQAKAAGYKNADCVLTSEIQKLLSLAKAGLIKEPVRLQYTAGPAWNFAETELGECRTLESAWSQFLALIEDWESTSPAYRALKKKMNEEQE